MSNPVRLKSDPRGYTVKLNTHRAKSCCEQCVFQCSDLCASQPCYESQRPDGASIYYVKNKPKRVKVDKDAAVEIPRSIVRLIRAWETQSKDGVTQLTKAAEIVRAIARRLEGKS